LLDIGATMTVTPSSSDTSAATFIEKIPAAVVPLGIIISSALFLFAQLAVIRLHAVFLPIIGFYKNLSLLSCFLGIGLGFLISQRSASTIKDVGFRFALPLVFLSIISPFAARDVVTPFTGELNMGLHRAAITE
jgi:hypothetical protein